MMWLPPDLARLDGYLGWETWAVWDGNAGMYQNSQWEDVLGGVGRGQRAGEAGGVCISSPIP